MEKLGFVFSLFQDALNKVWNNIGFVAIMVFTVFLFVFAVIGPLSAFLAAGQGVGGMGLLLIFIVSIFTFIGVSIIYNCCIAYISLAGSKSLFEHVKSAAFFTVENFSRLIVPVFLKSLLVMFGFMLFIAPGVYFALRLLPLEYTVIFEKLDFKQAFDRSTDIMDGHKVNFLALYAAIMIAMIVIEMILMSLGLINPAPEKSFANIVFELLFNFFSFFISACLYVTVFLFYNKRKSEVK